MKKTRFNLTIIVALTLVIALLLPAAGMAAPKALPEGAVYEFAPVPEGEKLSHEFVIKNQGDEVLEITDVIPP